MINEWEHPNKVHYIGQKLKYRERIGLQKLILKRKQTAQQ